MVRYFLKTFDFFPVQQREPNFLLHPGESFYISALRRLEMSV